ncbi:MAG: DUF3298 and DUF4163 domain-containing protein [Candidatus Paceibacterota bacterium]|jgi:uncharacterized protein YneF (UPF0154 family)|nr:DUF3298 and DUF4163 domain-containing protein [bacterium]
MENNKTLSLLIILALIAGVALGYYYPKNTEKKVIESIQPVAISDNPSITIATINQKDNSFDINAQYPQFTLADSSFNAKISNIINEKISEFKKNSEDNLKAVKETATAENPAPTDWQFYFKADWTPVQINKDYISFVVNMYYFSGGAHGNNEVYAFNYDLKNKKEITFNDFIGGSQETLKAISSLATKDVISQRASFGEPEKTVKKELEEGGTSPDAKNFNEFTFSNDTLTIYYQKYQVGPGALGMLKSSFDKSSLEKQSITSKYFK